MNFINKVSFIFQDVDWIICSIILDEKILKIFYISVPLVSRALPSDICRIHKCGASIRMDTTLADFHDMRWTKGDITFIFNGDQKPGKSLTVLDNKAKLFQRVRYEVLIIYSHFKYKWLFVRCFIFNLNMILSRTYFKFHCFIFIVYDCRIKKLVF